MMKAVYIQCRIVWEISGTWMYFVKVCLLKEVYIKRENVINCLYVTLVVIYIRCLK